MVVWVIGYLLLENERDDDTDHKRYELLIFVIEYPGLT